MRDEVFRRHAAVEDVHWWFVARRAIVAPLIDAAMSGRSGDLIADVGCGTGCLVATLSERYRCLGIDNSELAISFARAKYPGCRFLLADVSDGLREFSPEIALYTLMDVLEHLEEDREFLATVASLARPGAHILITVPAAPKLWSDHDVAANHVRRYDEMSFRALWAGLPVRPRVVTPYNARLYPAIWAARVAGRRLGLFGTNGGDDLALPPTPLNRALGAIFAGERKRVARLLESARTRPYRRGVSLLALLQREART